jgi:alcohol dehydrogenase class IV
LEDGVANIERTPAGLVRTNDQDVVFDCDIAQEIGRVAASHHMTRPFVLHARSLSSSTCIKDMTERYPDWHYCSHVAAHAPLETVRSAIEAYRSAGADGIVTVGGGSVSDTGKLIKLSQALSGRAFEALADGRHHSYLAARKDDSSNSRTVPLVCVPTTLSQAEFSDIVGMTVPTKEKHVLQMRELLPNMVLLDPALAASTPDKLWIATGIKAIDTAIYFLAGIPDDAELPLRLIYETLWTLADLMSEPVARRRNGTVISQLQKSAWFLTWIRSITRYDRRLATSAWPGAIIRHQIGAYLGLGHGEISAIVAPALLRTNAITDGPVGRKLAKLRGPEAANQLAAKIEDIATAWSIPTHISRATLTEARAETLSKHIASEGTGTWEVSDLRQFLENMIK